MIIKKNTVHLFYGFATVAVFFFCFASSVSAANLSLSPASGLYSVGDTFSVQVVVSSQDKSINAVSGILNFSADKLQVVSLSKNSSIINFWVVDPAFVNSSGKVSFEGVVLNPGFQSSRGVVLTLHLKAKSIGAASLSYSSASVLANDGQGTDVTAGLAGATFSIKAAQIEPKISAPEQAATSTVPESPSSLALQPAEILLGTKLGAPAVIGTSVYGKSQVILTFVASNGTKIFITGMADENGEFSIPVPNTLKRGLYTVTAVLVKDDGSHSNPSNEIVIKIGSIVSDIGWEIWLTLVLLVVSIAFLLLRVFFHVQKIKKVRVSNERHVREAENVLYESLNLLRKDITEHQSVSELEKDIDSAGKAIDKEIKGLES